MDYKIEVADILTNYTSIGEPFLTITELLNLLYPSIQTNMNK
ncbi:hypothetical protein LG36_0512 [Lactococcus lactis]|nr:hypothetical protein LG36_0512 [Lactococcus lactis]